jgi:hypothetical protein
LWSDRIVRSICSITDGGFNVLGNGLQALLRLRKEQEARIKQEQHSDVITKLLSEANKQSEKTNAERAPVKEVAPAK